MDQMSFTFRLSPHNRDYTTRNILSLEERVGVIREYERHPVYQHIAEKFNCSAKQIKNIVANKQALLNCYATCHTDDSTNEARLRRQQKIDFLDKVIYEYLLRALHHGLPLSANAVRAKALEVKECIAIENFYPNDEWMQNFKSAYKMPQFEQVTLWQRAVGPLEPRRASLKSIDIIHYVSQREKESQRAHCEQQRTPDENGNHAAHSGRSLSPLPEQNNLDRVNGSDPKTEEVTVVYEMVDDDDVKTEPNANIMLSVKANDSDEELAQTESESSVDKRLQKLPRAELLPALPDIHSYEEALQHLKVLEDFALIKDNYRAIGLITQLGQVFKHPPKIEDFES